MNFWEWNKIVGAILGSLIFVIVLGMVDNAVYQVPQPAKPGYIVPGVKVKAASTKATTKAKAMPKAQTLPDFATAIPAASVKQGKTLAQACAMCHDWAKGGPNKIGPNLWNIVGNKRGVGRNDFSFSSAMKAKGGTWTYAELFQFLRNPQEYIPGTKMGFPGYPKRQDRLDVIKYMRTWSDTPYPLPAASTSTEAGTKPPAKAPAAKAH